MLNPSFNQSRVVIILNPMLGLMLAITCMIEHAHHVSNWQRSMIFGFDARVQRTLLVILGWAPKHLHALCHAIIPKVSVGSVASIANPIYTVLFIIDRSST